MGKRRTADEVAHDKIPVILGSLQGTTHGLGNESFLRSAMNAATDEEITQWRQWLRDAGLVLHRAERILAEEQPIICANCGKPFTPVRADARYCSGLCRQQSHRAR